MSIYATTLVLADDEHEGGCAILAEVEPGLFDFSGKPCDCGTPRAPLVYEGSHVLPSGDFRRGGSLDLACIPDFITRDGRDDAQGSGPKDWLRLSMTCVESTTFYEGRPYVAAGSATLVLNRRHVTELRDSLTAWLEREPLDGI